jgi:hypothetical protein
MNASKIRLYMQLALYAEYETLLGEIMEVMKQMRALATSAAGSEEETLDGVMARIRSLQEIEGRVSLRMQRNKREWGPDGINMQLPQGRPVLTTGNYVVS